MRPLPTRMLVASMQSGGIVMEWLRTVKIIHAPIPLDAIGDIAEIQSASFTNQSSIPAGVPDLRCHLGRMRWFRGMRGMAARRLLAWCARHRKRLACIVRMARRTTATNADMQRRQAAGRLHAACAGPVL